MTGIYLIRNLVNGHCYVGQSIDIKQRWADHKAPRSRKRGQVLGRAFAKYGIQNFAFEMLEECHAEFLCDRECYWIALLKPHYNMTTGGEGAPGHRLSEEVRAILSAKAKIQWARKTDLEKWAVVHKNLIGPRESHPVSQESRAKISATLTGRKMPEEQRLKRVGKFPGRRFTGKMVVRIDPSNMAMRELHVSIREAAKQFNINPSNISSVLNGRQRTAGGWIWKYDSYCFGPPECWLAKTT